MTLLNHTYRQPNDWTCGPAVARVVLHSFGHKKTISEVSRQLRTTRGGTEDRHMFRLMRRHGLSMRVRSNATLTELARYVKSPKFVVVVAYWIPRHKEAHYSIVKRVTSKRVYFHDTWYGAKHSYSIKHFLRNWHDGLPRRSTGAKAGISHNKKISSFARRSTVTQHWFMAVRR